MQSSALSHLKRAPSMNIHRGRLRASLPSLLPALRSIGCKSGQIPAQSENNGSTPPRSNNPPLDMNLVKAFRQPPEVTSTAPKPETWPAEGYSATKFDPTVAYELFNRKNELKYIKELISRSCPGKVILLLGPENCGMTALLEKGLMKEDQNRFLHLNCGLEVVTTSAEMAQLLRSLAIKFPVACEIDLRSITMLSIFSWISRFVPPLLGLTTQADKDALAAASRMFDGFREIFYQTKDSNLTNVINGYEKVLLEASPGEKPVIVIDEVNKLKKWMKTPEEETNLECLLDFLKRICKEQNKAHVILATSNSLMPTWLEKNGISTESRMDVVLGTVTREEALRFVVGGNDSSGSEWPGLISAHDDLPPLYKEDWDKVWAKCGGNIYLLGICVSDAAFYCDWGKAVMSVGAATERFVNDAWLYATSFSKGVGSEVRLWTSEDYQIVVGLIADATPYYAVPQIVVAAELEKDGRLSKQGRGGVDGLQVLLSMLYYKVLSVRPYSDMAKDIPREVFFRMVEGENGIKEEQKDSVVMMPSPWHLFAALKKVD